MNKYLAANLSKEQQYTFEGAILKVYRPPYGSLYKCLKLSVILMTVAVAIMSVTVISATVVPMSIIWPAIVTTTDNNRHWWYINRWHIYPRGRNVCPNHRVWHIPTSPVITSPMLCTGGRTNTC